MGGNDGTEPVSYEAPEAWAEVGKKLNARRLALRMTIEEVAEAGRTSPVSVSDLEEGQRTSYRALTLARVAAGLRWPADAIPNMLLGKEPGPETVGSLFHDQRIESVEDRLNSLESEFKSLRATVAEVIDRLPPIDS